MKKIILPTIGILLVFGCRVLLAQSGQSEPFNATKLKGIAEDLWGNKINLSSYDKGVVLIHPFSPSDCGYCLFDGEFVRENYFRNNEEAGGSNFLQCLFNPQLDIYTYIKHYREASVPVLTFPPRLHDYHRHGFPFLMAFRDGKSIYRGGLSYYEEKFQSLHPQFWPKRDVRLTPTSPLFMGYKFIDENEHHLAVRVIPDEDEDTYKRLSEINKKWNSTVVRYEGELKDEDLQKNLHFNGRTERFKFTLFEDKDNPIKICSESIKIGDYEFSKADVGLAACFPNPFNRERYVVLRLWGTNLKSYTSESWVDYTIYKGGTNGKPEILLHGFFDKENNTWKFSPSLACGTATSKALCKEGVCQIPSSSPEKYKTHEHRIDISSWVSTPNGKIRTFGASACRFPSMAVDRDGVCWVVWEENGDILLASVNRPEPQMAIAVENDSSDSFDPIIAYDGSMLWIFYLNSRDSFYRLYGRSFDGARLSSEILITEKEPFDVVTPAITSNQRGKMVVAWSEWKANYRYLRHRIIVNRSLGEIQDVAIKKASIDYVNAWYPSLVIDSNGQGWGAWNQHYPALLGICAGNLVKEATSVTKLTGDINTNENGGYPSIVIDKHGKRWVFWESFGFDIARKREPQRILASYYDDKNEQWTLPYTLTVEKQTALNQTPKAAVDNNGVIWVVFSGRENVIDKPWGIYISRFSNNKWSVPKLISQEDVNSRAPNICIGKDGEIWITWHSGIGEDMRVRVLQYTPEIGDFEYLPGVNAEKKSTQSDLQRRLDDLGQQDEKYRRMSQEVARAFFQALSEENWQVVSKFLDPVSQPFKDTYGGLEIISIGEPFKPEDEDYDRWFVPYEVRSKSGQIRKHNLALLVVGPDGQFVVDGGL
ncbi:MAG: hypothetical protein ACETWQ_06255 [Phycisphaerae bacterium]